MTCSPVQSGTSEISGKPSDEFERRRLAREGWSKDSIESYRKFGHHAALLYPLIGVEGGVVAGGTPGTLVNVIGDTCRVLFGRPQTTDFWTWDVKPYARRDTGKDRG